MLRRDAAAVVSTVILVMNEKDTIGVETSVADLRRVVQETRPNYGILNEWPRSRDRATRKMLAQLGYGYGRPRLGGGPAFWRLEYGTPKITRRLLSGPGYVGRLPGRRSVLGPSWMTVLLWKKAKRALGGYHLTAEIQDVRGGGGYKTDPKYRRRVARHKREKRRIGSWGRHMAAEGWDVDMGGDSNFSHMKIGGFHDAWEGHPGGDLGGRPVTSVYSRRKPARAPRTIETRSDHDAVAVTYP